jgi:hypothetical protein
MSARYFSEVYTGLCLLQWVGPDKLLNIPNITINNDKVRCFDETHSGIIHAMFTQDRLPECLPNLSGGMSQ